VWHFFKIDVKIAKDYLRNLGLACVLGSLTGFFLQPHNSHQLVSIGMLLSLGSFFSYVGIIKSKEKNHD
jgi:hypothetical protein